MRHYRHLSCRVPHARRRGASATDLTPPHETARRIGPTAFALQLDVTQEEDWRSVAAKARDIGDVDIAVNNARYFPNRSIDDLDLQTWQSRRRIAGMYPTLRYTFSMPDTLLLTPKQMKLRRS